MIQIALHGDLLRLIASTNVRRWERGGKSHGRLFKSGSEKPVHGVSPLVAESGAWCNDLGGRWHKGELR
jgi:hypothetical protein